MVRPWFRPASLFSGTLSFAISCDVGGIQSYEDFHLNTYLWLQPGVLFLLPAIALSAQYAANAPANLPAPMDTLT
jgi:hypothetical protein